MQGKRQGGIYSDNACAGTLRLCCANLSSLPMSVLPEPAPQGLLLRALSGRGHNGLVDLLKRTAFYVLYALHTWHVALQSVLKVGKFCAVIDSRNGEGHGLSMGCFASKPTAVELPREQSGRVGESDVKTSPETHLADNACRAQVHHNGVHKERCVHTLLVLYVDV
eukprot:1136222-Pelagomonas_calceolata.AAC.4